MSNPSPPSSPGDPLPGSTVAWIEDDDALRDEGILFGVSGLEGIDLKQASIRSYYQEKIAACERERVWLEERRGDLAGEQVRLSEEIARVEARLRSEADPAQESGDWSVALVRYSVGLVLAVGMFICNWFLIDSLLEDRNGNGLISAGVMLVGMFVLFSPVSIMYRRGDGAAGAEGMEGWKIWTSEVVPGIAAALFTVVWSPRIFPIMEATTAFVFVAALFVFGGKLILSLLPRLTEALRHRRTAHVQRQIRATTENEYARLKGRRTELDQEGGTILRRLRALPGETELQRLADRKVSIFESEYHFARAAHGRMAAPAS